MSDGSTWHVSVTEEHLWITIEDDEGKRSTSIVPRPEGKDAAVSLFLLLDDDG